MFDIKEMFDEIADKYDWVNSLISFFQDKYWREKVADIIIREKIKSYTDKMVLLDVATGTGKTIIAIRNKLISLDMQDNLTLIGADFSLNMLKKLHQKQTKLSNISTCAADASYLPFRTNSLHIITITFGIRNMLPYLSKVLKEMHRVLVPNGKLIILDAFNLGNVVFRNIIETYIHIILPIIGNFLNKSSKNAYTYLAKSIYKFKLEHLISYLENNDFIVENITNLSLGVVKIIVCRKKTW